MLSNNVSESIAVLQNRIFIHLDGQVGFDELSAPVLYPIQGTLKVSAVHMWAFQAKDMDCDKVREDFIGASFHIDVCRSREGKRLAEKCLRGDVWPTFRAICGTTFCALTEDPRNRSDLSWKKNAIPSAP